MTFDFSFPRYLLSKQSVDDRALNKEVFAALQTALSASPTTPASSAYPHPESAPLSVIEVGAGIGTMLTRLLRWNALPLNTHYTLVDEMQENIDHARDWLPQWAVQNNLHTDTLPNGDIRVSASASAPALVTARFVCADMFSYIAGAPPKAELLIAHAVLDLLPMPESLRKLFSLLNPNGLAWLTINFDGVTSLEPVIDAALDAHIEHLYHASMDARPTGGDSRSGRHLFGHIAQAHGQVVAAGASDWVVYAQQGQYPAQEAYFLHCILHFFEDSLSKNPQLDQAAFANWLAARRAHIDRGELVYIAHQMDFLVRVQP